LPLATFCRRWRGSLSDSVSHELLIGSLNQ
jgi:hypothetical protein